jgi:hypothetical protein
MLFAGDRDGDVVVAVENLRGQIQAAESEMRKQLAKEEERHQLGGMVGRGGRR